jgi:type IV secretion system protein VirB11
MSNASPGDAMLLHLIAPILDPLNHPDVTDIVVNEPGRVGVRKAGLWEWLDVPAFTCDLMDAATILIAYRTGREFDEANPYVNSTLPGGQRFQGVRPPGTKPGRILWAIRRPPAKARTIDDPDVPDLFEGTNARRSRRERAKGDLGSLFKGKDWPAFFRAARLAGLSMGMCGPTGSGKSDFARRMIQVYRPGIRIVTLETDDEFGDAGPPNRAPLFYDDTHMTADEAVRIAKRLVPVEIFLQEVRGAEAWSMLEALESGHNGCTSWHAQEGREEESLADMARHHKTGEGIPEGRMIQKIRNAIDIIAYCERTDDNKFRVSSVRLMSEERPIT